MEFVVVLIVLSIACSVILIPWSNRSRIKEIEQETSQLKATVKDLVKLLKDKGLSVTEIIKPKPQSCTDHIEIKADTEIVKKQKFISKETSIAKETTAPKVPANLTSKKKTEPETKQKITIEQQFGARLPVWLGGIALAFAGFFLVKYSIENSLLSPSFRVIFCCLLGVSLLFAANWIRKKPKFANGIRIAQSLSGAGIAVLYVSTYTATSIYKLIPCSVGFLGMAAVTATTVLLSLKHGPPIALLGLIGGFITPAIAGGDISTPTLCIYLYFVFSGLMFVIKRNNLWSLSIPALLGSFTWVIIWINYRFTTNETIWIWLFIVAVCTTIFISLKDLYGKKLDENTKLLNGLNYVGFVGAIILIGFITVKANFGLIDWALFGFLSASGICLAYFKETTYRFVPWVSMLVNAAMIFECNYCHSTSKCTLAIIIASFGLLYAGSAYFLMWHKRLNLMWAKLACVSSIIYYLLAYFSLHYKLFEEIPAFWGISAIFLGLIAAFTAYSVQRLYYSHPNKKYLLAMFSATATALIAIGLAIELNTAVLPSALAAEMLAISVINSRLKIKRIGHIIKALTFIICFFVFQETIEMFFLAASSIVVDIAPITQSSFARHWPILQLSIPAIILIITSYFVRINKDDKLVRVLELSGIGLLATSTYYMARHACNLDYEIINYHNIGLVKRGVITNLLFIYGLVCCLIGRRFTRIAFSQSGIFICAIALFRIVYFDFFMYNPLFADQKIEGLFIFNTLLLPYGLPILLLWLAEKELFIINNLDLTKHVSILKLPLLFTLISLNIRYFFQGEYIHQGAITTNAEVYSYSIAWLMLGIALLFAGFIKNSKRLRYASLEILLLTVGKVFLYDAANLEGLYRVFSFFGLGISLLALSWFYMKFVFANDHSQEQMKRIPERNTSINNDS